MAAVMRRHEYVMPDHPSLQDVVVAIKMEREAREAAMADQQKHLDWRFVHFAEEFNLRLEQMEQKMDESLEDQSLQRTSNNEAFDSRRRHLQEGKMALLEARVAEVQRSSSSLEAQLEEQTAQLLSEARKQTQQIQEMQAWLSRTDLRLAGLEVKVPKHSNLVGSSEWLSPASSAAGTPAGLKGSQRLMHVERMSLDPAPIEVASRDDTELHSTTPVSHSHRGYSGDSGASTCSTTVRSGVHVVRERILPPPSEVQGKISWPVMPASAPHFIR